MALKRIEYICTYCGKKEICNTSMSKPFLGKCPRKPENKPHTWTINRKL